MLWNESTRPNWRPVLVSLLVLTSAGTAAVAAKGEWQLTTSGAVSGDQYSAALSTAGDFDGDGFEDLVVGAPFADDQASASGRAEIRFGGSDPSSRAPLTLLGDPVADDQFGISVAGGGDLNGDGHDDVAVGARFNDRATSDGGAVFVFFGGPSADGVADLVVANPLGDDWFGQSVAIVPDIDGDGDDELLVGAPFNDDAANAAGRALLYRGGAGMDATEDILCLGDPQSHAHFGWSVAGSGDVNGDGHGDWIVGARLWGTGSDSARGRAYVFLGGAGADGQADRTYTGERRDDWFGQTVAGVGDVNGDGFAEVGVGAVFWDRIDGASVVSAVGRVSVFAGGVSASTVPLATVDGAGMDDQMGSAIAGSFSAPWASREAWLAGARFADDGPVSAAGEIRMVALEPSGALRTLLISRGGAMDDQWGSAAAAIPAHLALAGSRRTYAGGAPLHDAGPLDGGSADRADRDCLTLRFSSPVEIGWSACAPFSSVGLLQGTLSAGVSAMQCAASSPAPPFDALGDPPVGEVEIFLIAGADGSGRAGTSGYGPSGEPRPTPDCP